MSEQNISNIAAGGAATPPEAEHNVTNKIVRTFLHSNLPLILILLATAVGITALVVTPREEDPQIVVPMADVYVNFPGHSAAEVERLVAAPLENLLHNIDGVEHVYSMSREGQAIITVRYYVGQDRERSLVKLFKKIDENVDRVPPGVTGWVVKPVEIDDVPIVTLTLTGADDYLLRRTAEEAVQRLSTVPDISRAYVVGGLPRVLHVYLSPQRLEAYQISPLEVQRALVGANVTVTAGEFTSYLDGKPKGFAKDAVLRVEAGKAFERSEQVKELVVGVSGGNPVFLKDVADVKDGPAEVTSYVRHEWGPGRNFEERPGAPGAYVGPHLPEPQTASESAVSIAIAKKKGSNAVTVAENVLAEAAKLKKEAIPDNVNMVVTRNAGLNSNDKVNDLIEALAVALILAVAVLTLALGWRESLIVALAVPVVFGLTLAINLLAGLTINRVTLFALILSLGLLVDDPIVDVENIVRHFRLRKKANRGIVLEAVSEIRPPLIAATLAVIASFLPLFFITGMMGPYMRPMALNVPVTMVMSMVVAFMITPWLAYHFLKKRYNTKLTALPGAAPVEQTDPHALGNLKESLLYRAFRPLMAPLLNHRWAAWSFLGVIGVLFVISAGLALTRHVPLKMLPYGNKNELSLVLNMDEGTTLEKTDAAVRDLEAYLRGVPEVTDFTSYVGLASPMDFNGLVRHYYLRQGQNIADVQVSLVDRKSRPDLTHALALRLRDDLTKIAAAHNARLKVVEAPPGPPVLSTVVAEVYGKSDNSYRDLIAATRTVEARMKAEPGVRDVDTMIEAQQDKLVFVTDKEKASLSDVTTEDIASTLQMSLGGQDVGVVREAGERNALVIQLRLPRGHSIQQGRPFPP